MKNISNYRMRSILSIVLALAFLALACGQGRVTQAPQEPGALPPAAIPSDTPVTEPEEPPPGGQGEIDMVFDRVTVDATGDGYQVAISVTVSNAGSGQLSSSFTVRWHPHGRSDEVGCSWDIEARRANSGPVTVGCTYDYGNFGDMHWRASVDSDDDLRESNEDNNLENGTIQIKKAGGGEKVAAPNNCNWQVASVPRNIIVTFNYTGADIDGFRVYYAGTTLMVEVGPNDRQAMVTNLELATQYHFDVRAFKGDTESKVDACFVDATTGN